MKRECIAIIDFGGENNQTIARLIRSMNVFCKVFSIESFLRQETDSFAGLVFVGSESVHEDINTSLPSLDLCGKSDYSHQLKDFIFEICKCKADWNMKNFTDDMIEEIKSTVGDRKALLALSGGVDSTVCAVLVNRAIGDRLTCVFVDTGLMRLNEGDEVVAMFKEKYGIDIIRVNAESRFLSKLTGVTDPEQKRKIIGEEFIRVFEEEAKKIGKVDFFVQGTIYPDIIESGTKSSAVIKSHHNVGGLPDIIDFEEIIEPLKDLFKDEVRAVGLELSIPHKMIYRQPFPGPGLGVRVIGEITKEKLDILRKADFIFRDEVEKANLEIWQYFCVLTDLKSVGICNGERTYGYTLALRAVNTIDAMSAEYVRIPYDTIDKSSRRITDEVKGITRIVYDVTSKPPATIEWE